MNNAYINGFVAEAKKSGLSDKVAIQLLSKLADANTQMFQDPAASAGGPPPGAGAPPPGAGGPPPMDPAQAADPNAQTAVPNTGVPPEIEQLIQQLPPEVLEQLLAEIQAEIANGQGGQGAPGGAPAGADPAAGMPTDPSAGPPPMDPNAGLPKQGEQLIAKEASYVEGFYERAIAYGFDKNTATEIYKKAVDLMSNTAVTEAQPKLADKQASSAHFEGFLLQARNSGLTDKEATDIYGRYFNN